MGAPKLPKMKIQFSKIFNRTTAIVMANAVHILSSESTWLFKEVLIRPGMREAQMMTKYSRERLATTGS